jgi:hypothetical protein
MSAVIMIFWTVIFKFELLSLKYKKLPSWLKFESLYYDEKMKMSINQLFPFHITLLTFITILRLGITASIQTSCNIAHCALTGNKRHFVFPCQFSEITHHIMTHKIGK